MLQFAPEKPVVLLLLRRNAGDGGSQKGYKRAMNRRVTLICGHILVAFAICAAGCTKRNKDNASSNGEAQASASGALDRCIIGTWKSTEATLDLKLAHASGGANVEMKIDPSGACTMNFTPMSVINATAKPVNFDFHYSGKVTALLKTPSAGVIAAAQSDYSGLKASAMVHMPNGATMPLLTNVPVASMAPTTGPKASPSGTTQGIDSSPVVSADSYTCSALTLTLSSSIAHTRWTFSKFAQ